MLDHIGITASDLKRSTAFYEKALAPLGYSVLMEIPTEYTGGVMVLGFVPFLWIGDGGKLSGGRVHLAFRASTRAAVDAFHAAAIAAGGKDNGPPGLRPHYHATYYAAFVYDPDGHNIEAVCHAPE